MTVRRLASRAAGVVVAAAAAAALPAAVSGAKQLGPDVWPSCTPLCAHTATTGPRVTAIYVTAQRGRARPRAVVDVFAAGINAPSATGQLCYQTVGFATQPGCAVDATAHARHVGAGMWWLHFTLPVYERWQISASASHALVRSYWFGVFVRAGRIDVDAAHPGRFRRL
jgi:hypothetical protein